MADLKKSVQDKILSAEILEERAREYATGEEILEIRGELKEFLGFRLGGEWYLVDMRFISEILVRGKISRIPQQAEIVAGMMNVRGRIILVLELGMFLNLSKSKVEKASRVVFLKTGSDITGFFADEVCETLKLDTGISQGPISTIAGKEAAFIKRLFNYNGKHFIWLDVEKLMAEAENRLGR